MKTSPSAVKPLRNSATFSLSALVLLPSLSLAEPSSSMWKRRFSKRTTPPLSVLLTMASTSEPTQSGAKVTDLPPNSFSSSGTTGCRLYLGLGLPLGRPRWDIRTTALAPLSMAYLMVGIAPAMRWLLVIFLSASRGTLKSTYADELSDCVSCRFEFYMRLRGPGIKRAVAASRTALSLALNTIQFQAVSSRDPWQQENEQIPLLFIQRRIISDSI